MYSNGINLNAASYKNLFSTSSGNLIVPVKPSAVIYSQLDHVHGTAASAGQNGVPVSRVRILNTLINQLVAMKKATPNEDELNNMSDEQKDALIEEYQTEIRNAVQASSQPNTYGLAGIMPETGTLVSFTA